MANRWVIGLIVFLMVTSVGLYVFARDPHSEKEIRQLIGSAYNAQRPGGGRLSGASYTPAGDSSAPIPGPGRAQLLLLRQPDSETRQRLQALVYLSGGEWKKFIDLGNAIVQSSIDPAMRNNIGASYLALSESDPTLLLKAIEAFEQALQSDPNAPEPLFNLAIAYRKLRFHKLATDAFDRYSALDAVSEWHGELANPSKVDEATILDQLQRAVENNDLAEAERLFQENPELCRRAVMQYAFSGETESTALMQFIATQMDRYYVDKTISAMIAPLSTKDRDATIAIRQLVNEGAAAYSKGEWRKSISAYKAAQKLAAQTDSLFDRFWIDLNKVDTQIRLGEFEKVRDTLSHMIPLATEHGFLWLRAKAMSIYGSTLRLTSSYTEMLDLLSQADADFIRLDAPNDRIRVLYYLAAYRYYAGDQEEGLRLALECLRLVHEEDPVRIATLDWLIGSILYRRGMPEKSLIFAKESFAQSQKGPYANGIEFLASITLAELYQSMSQHTLADEYLSVASEAFEEIPSGYDHIRYELLLGIVQARAKMNQQRYDEAEFLLQKNLNLYSQQPFSATALLSQSLMLLARVYSETGRTKQADQKFTEAIDVVEKDDEYLKLEMLRVKFDDERRDLYDSAIEFEFRNGSLDSSWTYLQKYRAKLFLEFLAGFDPDIEPTRTYQDRAAIQRRIPKNTQIVEYALLKNRMLIWLMTDNLFVVRSLPVKRADIEAKVQKVLQQLRTKDSVDGLLTELGTLLIQPVAELLDPNRTLAIIPDRALHGLPFGALKQPGKEQYLVQEFAIVASPSLTHFLTGDRTRPRREEIVGFGSKHGGSTEVRELAALSKIYPKSITVIGQQVGKESFLSGLQQAAVFHYAGHSATDAADPLRSSILLDGDRSGPNSVTAVDIARQRLPNNAVVVLSSCDSSVGNSRDGIGVRGLTSAFLIGGAGSVVGSLWPVEALSTAELMIRFHRAFAKSEMPVAEALREAQIAFLKTFPEKSHPYYWSGFIVTGNFSALR